MVDTSSDEDPPTVTLTPGANETTATRDLPPALAGGRYRVAGVIGKGGQGVVVRCHDGQLDRDVAVKLLGDGDADDQTRSRFLAEARLQGRLQHPAIVPVYDVGATDDGRELFVMREIDGITLRSVLRRSRTGDGRPEHGRARLLAAFSSVCRAVDYCHSRGVIHRDLKPENVMLGEFGEVYLLDWGLAGAPAALAGRQGGTLGYAAPEQLAGAPGVRSDVFSLGAILLELIAVPAVGRDDAFADHQPPELVALGRRAMDLDPARRPASARELADSIDRYLDGERDLALRRRMADDAIRAAAAAGAADDPAHRRTALRGAGRALALDPDHAEARALLRELLASPPHIPELNRRWAGFRTEAIRGAATAAAIGFAGVFAVAPIELWMGVRSPGWFAARQVLNLIALVSCLGLGRWWKPTVVRTTIAFLAGILQILSTALLLGPFVMLPTLAGLIVALLSMLWGRRWLIAAWAVGLAIALGPLVLELAGGIAPSMRFEHGELVLVPRLLELPPTPTLLYLVAKDAAILAVVGAMLGRFRDALASAERRLRVHAWQLEQLAG